MSVIGDVLNQLGKDVMPQVGAIVFPDVMDIYEATPTRGTGGGIIKGTSDNVYKDVPVAYKPTTTEMRTPTGGKLLSRQEYELTFPTHDSFGERINFDIAKHRFTVLERGSEPEKTFRPVALQDVSGVVFKVVCEREN